MISVPDPDLQFRSSSLCSKGNCVEVAPLPDGGAVIRDSKHRSGPTLLFDSQEWAQFVAGVKHGEFDFS